MVTLVHILQPLVSLETTYGYMNATASSYSTVYGKSHTQSYNGAAAYAAQQNASINTNAYLQQQYQIKAQINEG